MEVIEETTLQNLAKNISTLKTPANITVRVTIEEVDKDRDNFQKQALMSAAQQFENETVEYSLEDVKEEYE